ncbi:hypothetical protein TRM7615_01147 [Falsiruegeria mediterranea M17]|uniref:Uncharacterized protein n=1 Tax=Falsiruegeria mediterranea M17 TaxID=1200281 RepID=A0A2R8C5G4_9RHOB|nr:hypothetical protein TRM7615_01147 [Falsiruegeria mediterranea M17]
MMLPQLPGFERPKRKPPRVMAKLYDAGGEVGKWICYRCNRCGWDSGWIDQTHKSDTEIKRGHPCPECNMVSDG